MDRYVIIDGPRVLKLTDGIPVAELVTDLWAPARHVDPRDMNAAVELSEQDVASMASVPGSVVTAGNIRWLWDFTCAAAAMCKWEYDRFLGYFTELEEQLEEGSSESRAVPGPFGDVWIECQAAAYIVLRNKAMRSGYMDFDQEIGPIFLDHYAFPFYAKASPADKYEIATFREKIRHFASEYDRAAVDEARPVFPQAPWTWEKWKDMPSNWYTRIGFCLCHRVFLRAQGVPEESMDYDEKAPITTFNFSDCALYIPFTWDFAKQWMDCDDKFGAGLPLYDECHKA